MTPEEIQKKIDGEIAGLKRKNEELLAKLSDAKKITDRLSGVDLDKLIEDSKELSEYKKKSDEEKGEYKKLYEQLKGSMDEEKKKLESDLKRTVEDLATLRKTTAIAGELSKIGVDPVLLDIATKYLIPHAAIDSDKVLLGGKSPEEFAKEWAVTDIGKKFVISGNSGGGATGSDDNHSGGNAKFFDKKSRDYSLTEQAKLAKTNIAGYNRLRKQFS